jgi:Flp pilus assembly CpaF family ATPase
MTPNRIFELESLLVPALKGKLELLQPQDEREAIVLQALENFLKNDQMGVFAADFPSQSHKQHFAASFFSYGVIEEMLSDINVEDIIINGLKPIYIHHAQDGFISTDKCFSSRKELDLFINKLLVFAGRKDFDKIVNLELPNLAGRVNIIKAPFGPQLCHQTRKSFDRSRGAIMALLGRAIHPSGQHYHRRRTGDRENDIAQRAFEFCAGV